jgi:hypothetical protein
MRGEISDQVGDLPMFRASPRLEGVILVEASPRWVASEQQRT